VADRSRIFKFPRTQHLEGSRLQPGDEDLASVPFTAVAGQPLVVEEKLDGANSGVSFAPDGTLLLQSRGHYLTGGRRERHFDLFKQWATAHRDALHDVLGARYVMYGEWLYAAHTVYYDRLPHYFVEFDVLDTERDAFLSTARRRELFAGTPVVSAPVLAERSFGDVAELTALLGPSTAIGPDHLAVLDAACRARGLDPQRARRQTDPSGLMEGLYLKAEAGGVVTARYKWVRHGFLQVVDLAEGHWLDRPIVPNLLREGVDIFAANPAAASTRGAADAGDGAS
jgi:hypothetical protein